MNSSIFNDDTIPTTSIYGSKKSNTVILEAAGCFGNFTWHDQGDDYADTPWETDIWLPHIHTKKLSQELCDIFYGAFLKEHCAVYPESLIQHYDSFPDKLKLINTDDYSCNGVKWWHGPRAYEWNLGERIVIPTIVREQQLYPDRVYITAKFLQHFPDLSFSEAILAVSAIQREFRHTNSCFTVHDMVTPKKYGIDSLKNRINYLARHYGERFQEKYDEFAYAVASVGHVATTKTTYLKYYGVTSDMPPIVHKIMTECEDEFS